MVEVLKPDICVIGAGSGGLSVAAAAAGFGVPVVLIERGRMGGDCLNYGCVPSKSLLAAARHVMASARGPEFGVAGASATVDFRKVRDHIRGVIAAIAPNDSTERFTALGVRVIAGTARFADAATVAVGDAFAIQARRFVIATGSAPAIPPIPGLAQAPYLTNETIFDLGECPSHLVVIGAGPVGLELAQAFRALGADVTVIEAATPLAHDDPECTAVVLDQLARDGVVIRSGATIARVDHAGGKVQVVIAGTAGEQAIAGSHLLVAAGRTPNLANLGLDEAGIAVEPRGIVVDRRLRTTNRRVYAVGDVAGGPRFTHVASYHAGLVIRQTLFRLPVRVNHDSVPRVTFTEPELAHVGLSEAEARRRKVRFRVLRWPYHENDRAQAERATQGHIKVVITNRGRILGATIVGHNAGELIATWTLAIERRLNIRAFAATVVAYPTLAEIGKRAAITHFTSGLTSPMVRRIIAWLRRFG
jgi:pyruvate/2-oxoglutarate dehydrogenase complex dihydrolipoamide dehydrogenase (E3) component